MKTFLQLVNSVLVEMREEEVTTINSTVYSRLIGTLVNKAKEQVEDAHNWSCLLTDLTFSTIVGTETYALTGSDNRINIENVIDTTNKSYLNETTRQFIQSEYMLGDVASSTPTKWANTGTDATGQAKITLYPKPVAITAMNVHCFLRTPDLVAETDTTLIPHAPIRDLAIAFAVRERGEVGGTAVPEYLLLAQRALSDAIAYDAARNETDQVWYEV